VKVYKGTNPEVDSYSVFWDNKKLTQTSLVSQLSQTSATDIYVCGLAYDVCVGESLLSIRNKLFIMYSYKPTYRTT
jgi:exosome complex component RRP4